MTGPDLDPNDPDLKPFLKEAKRCLEEVGRSGSGLLVYDGKESPESAAWIFYMLQIGHFALHAEKPLIFCVPTGQAVPPRLEKMADAIVRYNPDDPTSLHDALSKAIRDHVVPKVTGAADDRR